MKEAIEKELQIGALDVATSASRADLARIAAEDKKETAVDAAVCSFLGCGKIATTITYATDFGDEKIPYRVCDEHDGKIRHVISPLGKVPDEL